MEILTTREIENFGRNLRFTPQVYYEPSTEAEILQILQRHSGQKIKAVGSLHSWSSAAECHGVVISLRLFDGVRPVAGDSQGSAVWVGGGIKIKHLLSKLARYGKTLPSLGLITEQTIAGAISTGTHGSGRHCLSHYVQAVRIARYDRETGEPIIEEVHAGELLRAAQCGLGNIGVIVAVKIECRERYNIAETWRRHGSLDEVLQSEASFPLQQFFLIPWRWSYLAQHRLEVAGRASASHWLYRVYFFLAIDIGLHLVILTIGKLLNSKRWVHFAFRNLLWRSIITNWTVLGDSNKMLVMEHALFRHIETELFVTRDQLSDALEFVQHALIWAAGDGGNLPERFWQQVSSAGLSDDSQAIQGLYCHHYPICVRCIQPDTTMISMSSGGDQDWYAMSLISYHSVRQRDGFEKTMNFVARCMALLFGARPHWGKFNPLLAKEIVQLYPEMAMFQDVCEQLDSQCVFRNRWFDEVLQATTENANSKS